MASPTGRPPSWMIGTCSETSKSHCLGDDRQAVKIKRKAVSMQNTSKALS